MVSDEKNKDQESAEQPGAQVEAASNAAPSNEDRQYSTIDGDPDTNPPLPADDSVDESETGPVPPKAHRGKNRVKGDAKPAAEKSEEAAPEPTEQQIADIINAAKRGTETASESGEKEASNGAENKSIVDAGKIGDELDAYKTAVKHDADRFKKCREILVEELYKSIGKDYGLTLEDFKKSADSAFDYLEATSDVSVTAAERDKARITQTAVQIAKEIERLRSKSSIAATEQMATSALNYRRGVSPFNSYSDYAIRFIEALPKTWKMKVYSLANVMNLAREGKDLFGRKVQDETTRPYPEGVERLENHWRSFLYDQNFLSFNLPVMEMDSYTPVVMNERATGNLDDLKTWNITKYANYVYFIRDQVSLLPAAHDLFTESFKDSDFLQLVAEDLTIDGEPIKDANAALKSFESYLWKGFNRALINNVITPSIRTLAVGGQHGMIKLSNIDVMQAAFFYASCLRHISRATPKTFISNMIMDFLHKNNTWVSDVQILREISSDGISQSAPFVIHELAEAIDDAELKKLADIANFSEFDEESVTFSVLGVQTTRKVTLRNVYGDPLLLEDDVKFSTDNDLVSIMNSKELMSLITVYVTLQGSEVNASLTESHLARYLEMSGMVAIGKLSVAAFKQSKLWYLIEKIAKLKFLSMISTGKTVNDKIAPYYVTSSASLQSMSDYGTSTLAIAHEAVSGVIRDILSVIRASREYFDHPIWKEMEGWSELGIDAAILKIPTSYTPKRNIDKKLITKYESATANSSVREGALRVTQYYVDESVLDFASAANIHLKEYVDMLKMLGIKGKMTNKVFRSFGFNASFDRRFDATLLPSSGLPMPVRTSLMSAVKVITTRDEIFSLNNAINNRPLVNLSVMRSTDDIMKKSNDGSATQKLISDIKWYATHAEPKDNEEQKNVMFPGVGYSLIAEMNPTVIVNYSDDGDVTSANALPLKVVEQVTGLVPRSGELFDAQLGLNWRDRSDATFLRYYDVSNYIEMRTNVFKMSESPNAFVLPETVDEFRKTLYASSYSVTEDAVAANDEAKVAEGKPEPDVKAKVEPDAGKEKAEQKNSESTEKPADNDAIKRLFGIS